jgi:hypothetical protein
VEKNEGRLVNVRAHPATKTKISPNQARKIARNAYPQASDAAVEFLAKAAIDALSPQDPQQHPVSKLKRPYLGDTLPNMGRKCFDRICSDRGPCDPYVLSAHFYLAGYEWSFSDDLSAWEMVKVPREGMKELPDELERLAKKIYAVSPMLEQYFRSYSDNSHLPDRVRAAARVQLHTCSQVIPCLLQELAKSVTVAELWLTKNVGPKRVGSRRLSLLRLLKYVRDTTKKPHFADVASVLGYVVSENDELLLKPPALGRKKRAGRVKELPTPAMLKQVWHRAVKYNLLPKQG